MSIKNLLISGSILLLISACSTIDPQPSSGSQSVTPDQVSQRKSSPGSTPVEWGGVIARLENLRHSTELQVIAYPLGKNSRPDTDAPPIGRFIAVNGGYLESADYAQGRQVTISGIIDRLREGKVGQAEYLFPVMLVRNIRLWPKQRRESLTPRFNFGFGIGSGGSSSGSVGVGIGF